MTPMTTLSETLSQLQKEGYTEDFNLKDDCKGTCLNCQSSRSRLQKFPDAFVLDHQFRFEGPSDPADEAVVYAISSVEYNLKGTLVNGYGANSDALADALVMALKPKPE